QGRYRSQKGVPAMRRPTPGLSVLGVSAAFGALLLASGHIGAQNRDIDPLTLTSSLKTVPIPEVTNLGQYVQSRSALIALGKAFFWDQQAGSDGQACGSCH